MHQNERILLPPPRPLIRVFHRLAQGVRPLYPALLPAALPAHLAAHAAPEDVLVRGLAAVDGEALDDARELGLFGGRPGAWEGGGQFGCVGRG